MLQIQLTADDYIAANFVHARWTAASWARIGLISAALIGFGIYQMQESDDIFYGGILFAYAIIMWLMIALSRYYLMPRRARRVFEQTKSLQRLYRWSWNGEQLSYNSDLATAIVPWADLVKWREGEESFLLYPSDLTFYVFPKRAFESLAAIDAFRQMLRERISSATSASAF